MKISFLKHNITASKAARSLSRRPCRGFTLIESLMSILILTISIMAPLELSLQTVKYSRIALEKVRSTYIAEEAVEMINNIKKSAEIYCSDPAAPLPMCYDYFGGYFLNGGVLDNKCVGLDISGGKKFCNFDFSNMEVSPLDKSVKLTNVNSSYSYIIKNNLDVSSATSQNTGLKRSINITFIDNNIPDGQSAGSPGSALITSIVCVREVGICNESSANKVVLENLISR